VYSLLAMMLIELVKKAENLCFVTWQGLVSTTACKFLWELDIMSILLAIKFGGKILRESW